MQNYDPLTGLELKRLEPTAAQHSNRFLTDPAIRTPEVDVAPVDSIDVQGAKDSPSFLESVAFALTGPSDEDLKAQGNEGKLAARESRRAQAGAAAASYKNPGRQYMQPVSGGSGSGLESLGKIAQLLGGIG